VPVAEVDSHKSKLTLDTRFDEADEYVHFQVTGMDEIALIFFPKPDLRSRLESTTKGQHRPYVQSSRAVRTTLNVVRASGPVVSRVPTNRST